MPTQDEFPFASLDFPGRTTLYPGEVQERLGISRRHLDELIDAGDIPAVNIAGSDHGAPKKAEVARRYYRIPVESYREFVVTRLSGPARRLLLRQLPKATLRELHAELETLIN